MFATFNVKPLRFPRPRLFLGALIAVAAISLGLSPGVPGRAAQNPGEWPTRGDSLAGRLVVATESMGDPRFQNTVIYLVEHTADGAMGLIVNQPFGAVPMAPLFERLGLEAPGAAPGAAKEIAVYYGGPVEPERGFLLHSAEVLMEGSILVGDGVAMTAEAEMMQRIARGEGPERSLFAFGYSGWGPHQLESEFDRNDWFAIPFDASLVFALDPSRSWKRAAARRGLDL